jgi:hypothetical protein
MKKLLGLALAFAVILVMVGCDGEVTLDTPDVSYTVDDQGATLVLDWIEIADADGYYIIADGDIIDTLDDPGTITYDATIPAAVYEVQAYAGEDVSGTDEIDCAPVVTEDLDIYFLSDPDTLHPSGLSFTSSGSATAISVQAANYTDLDYLFDDRAPLATTTLMSPNAYSPVYNSEKNMGVLEQGITDFSEITIAAAPGNYSTQTDISGNAYYSFYMDQDDDNWDTDSDYFGKIYVQSITGTHAIITVAYQPITGLRWCVTD